MSEILTIIAAVLVILRLIAIVLVIYLIVGCIGYFIHLLKPDYYGTEERYKWKYVDKVLGTLVIVLLLLTIIQTPTFLWW